MYVYAGRVCIHVCEPITSGGLGAWHCDLLSLQSFVMSFLCPFVMSFSVGHGKAQQCMCCLWLWSGGWKASCLHHHVSLLDIPLVHHILGPIWWSVLSSILKLKYILRNNFLSNTGTIGRSSHLHLFVRWSVNFFCYWMIKGFFSMRQIHWELFTFDAVVTLMDSCI